MSIVSVVDANRVLKKRILARLAGRQRASVVSNNAICADLQDAWPECGVPDSQMTKLIAEVALHIGLVPVTDPLWKPARVAWTQTRDQP